MVATEPITLKLTMPEAFALMPPRQMQAIRLIASGVTRKQAASRMGIRTQQVERLVSQARVRLGVQTDASLGAALALAGLVQLQAGVRAAN